VGAGGVVVGALDGAEAAGGEVVAPAAPPDRSPSPHPVKTTATASAASIQFRTMQPSLA